MIKIIPLMIILTIIVPSILRADEFRVFKRLSDSKVKIVQMSGTGIWPRSADETFARNFDGLESYEMDVVSIYPRDTKSIDIVNGRAVFIPFTQEEIDARPENVKKRAKAQAVLDLRAAQSVPALRAALETLLDL